MLTYHMQLKPFNSDFAKWWNDSVPSGWEGLKFMKKLKLIKGKMKKWNAEVFGDMKSKKQSLLRRIKKLVALESSGMWNN